MVTYNHGKISEEAVVVVAVPVRCGSHVEAEPTSGLIVQVAVPPHHQASAGETLSCDLEGSGDCTNKTFETTS